VALFEAKSVSPIDRNRIYQLEPVYPQEYFGIEHPTTHKQLYAVTDSLFAHKEKIDSFSYSRISTLFDLKDKPVIFDFSNTYFEACKANIDLVKYGRRSSFVEDERLIYRSRFSAFFKGLILLPVLEHFIR
jgi:hypothetical protein